MKSFGGTWTEQKLNAFIKYVKAYLVIINKYKKKYKWETIYFDGFAGFGEKLEKSKEKNHILNLFELEEKGNDATVYKGFVSRILQLPEPFIFDWYYFIDTNEKYIANLEKIKSEIEHIDKKKIIIRNEDCNKQLIELAHKALSNKMYSALIFLDPFGMQVN